MWRMGKEKTPFEDVPGNVAGGVFKPRVDLHSLPKWRPFITEALPSRPCVSYRYQLFIMLLDAVVTHPPPPKVSQWMQAIASFV